MGLSSSLNAGVAGLAVNAVKLATISDNIANSQTIGYKRADAEFADLVLQQQSGARASVRVGAGEAGQGGEGQTPQNRARHKNLRCGTSG